MDIITFIVIAIVIYSIFSKKDKPPQRRPMRPEDNQPLSGPLTETPRKKSRNIFEDMQKQLQEVEQRFEREVRGDYTEPGRTAKPKASASRTGNKSPYNAATEERRFASKEGDWGTEGRSEYDKYVSTQGTQGTEGVGGTEGFSDSEGTWGTEGDSYAKKQADSAAPALLTPQKMPAFNLGFSSSEITRGVIWSEILNEPRARRPHPRR